MTSSTDWRSFISKYYKKFGKCPIFFKRYCKEQISSNLTIAPMDLQSSEMQDFPTENGVWTPYFDETAADHAFLTKTHDVYLVKVTEYGNSVVAFCNTISQKITFFNGTSHDGLKYEFIFTFTDLKHKQDFSTDLFGNWATFRVKGKHEITVKLLSSVQCFEISIAVITNHYIGINECFKQFSSTVYVEKGLLNSKESRGFWVYWSSTGIFMGLEGDLEPRIKLEGSVVQSFHEIEYKSKSVVEWKAPSYNLLENI